MKLQTSQNDVQSVGSQERNGFSIEASAKAFLILSDGLYSDKIKAVVRELSTNAYDSHIEAGCADMPFDVHVPNNIDPYFSIRDYGVGMCHEDCMTLYTTYFRSTKNNSNDAVGCLGLGSKSPFAYTDSFTVESFYNGTKRTYTGYKNSEGFPDFDLMNEEETDEPNGILVKLPVKSYDFSEFIGECEQIYKHFKVKPNITGAFVEIPEVEKIVSGDNWYIGNGHENCVVMGQVAYPIDPNAISEWEPIQQFINNVNGFVLSVNIGDLDITPSRESLSYNKTTTDNLCNAIAAIVDDITEKANAEFSDCATLYEARIKYLTMEKVLLSYSDDVSWNGQKLFDDMRNKSIRLPSGGGGVVSYFKHNFRKSATKDSYPYSIKFQKGIKNVIFKDLKTGAGARVGKYITDNGWCDTHNVYVYEGEKVEDLLELLGGATKDDIVFLSDLPKPVYYSNSGGGVPCKTFDESTGMLVDSKMSVKYEDAIYIEEARGKIDIGNRNVSMSQFEQLLVALLDLGCDFGGTFYTVKPSDVYNKNLNSRANWKSGKTVIKELVQELVDDKKEDYELYRGRVRFNEEQEAKAFFKDFSSCEVSNLLDEYDAYVEEMEGHKKNLASLDSVLSIYGNYGFDFVPRSDLDNGYFDDKYQDIIERKYPSLSVFSPWESEIASQYIKDMNELHQLREEVENFSKMHLTTV